MMGVVVILMQSVGQVILKIQAFYRLQAIRLRLVIYRMETIQLQLTIVRIAQQAQARLIQQVVFLPQELSV